MDNDLLTLDGRDKKIERLQTEFLRGLLDNIDRHTKQIMVIETEVVKLKDVMEKEIYLTPAQCQAVRNEVSRRVRELLEGNPNKDDLRRKYFAALWQAAKNHFEVNTYLVIPRQLFGSVLLYVRSWYPVSPIE